MRFTLFITFLFVFIYSCAQHTETKNNLIEITDSVAIEKNEIDTLFFDIKFTAKDTYANKKKEIQNNRILFKQSYVQEIDSTKKMDILRNAGNYFNEALLNEIIPFWYGTSWSFSGYTDKPNKGEVGCSYFVSTTLLHCGLKLNRYHLAQQNPENEAKTLLFSDSLVVFNYSDTLIEHIEKEFNDGMYFAGLDNHVGYLLIRKGKAFFINSSYLQPVCVEIQFAEDCEVFKSSRYFFVPIGNNTTLIKKWLLEEEIHILRNTNH